MLKLISIFLLTLPCLIKAQEGTACNATISCDLTKFLECDISTETCYCKSASVWDTIQEICLVPYDKACQNETGEPPCNQAGNQKCLEDATTKDFTCQCVHPSATYNPTDGRCNIKQGWECDSDDECGPSAKCEESPPLPATCKCLGHFPPNPSGECLSNYGDTCSPSFDICDWTAKLKCNACSFKCDCEKGSAFDQTGVCKKLAGQSCTLDDDCFSLSKCMTDTTNPIAPKICQCDASLQPGISGKCVIPYNAACSGDPTMTCDKEGNQMCRDTCTCIDETNMQYDRNLRSCYLRKNTECNNENCLCHPDLACDATTSLCTCDGSRGFVENKDGDCKLMYNYSCDVPNAIGLCNNEDNLVCGTDSKICECRANYTDVVHESKNRITCLGTYGAPCTEHANCYVNASVLGCHPTLKECRCFYDKQEYNEREEKCYSLLGGHCDIDASDEDNRPSLTSCMANMDCTEAGICKCKEGYMVISDTCSDANINLFGRLLIVSSVVIVFMKTMTFA